MKRGFKSWCENVAIQYRKELQLPEDAPLDPRKLAKFLGVFILNPIDIEGLSSDVTQQLLENDPESWSAVALCVNDQYVVIHNDTHSPGRQSSNIMHELAHIIIGHEAKQNCFSADTQIFLRYYDKEQEEEADWLAATLLLPKPALFSIKNSGLDNNISAQNYGVSAVLLRYRLDKSGVNIIHRRRAKKHNA